MPEALECKEHLTCIPLFEGHMYLTTGRKDPGAAVAHDLQGMLMVLGSMAEPVQRRTIIPASTWSGMVRARSWR
jgi:hypothetical protein